MIMVGVCIARRNVIFQTCGRSHWTRLLVCLLLGWETVSHVSQTFLDLCGTVNDLEFLFFLPCSRPNGGITSLVQFYSSFSELALVSYRSQLGKHCNWEVSRDGYNNTSKR